MRKYLFLAAAATLVATPAAARDGSMYVGIEGGPMLADQTSFDFGDDENDVEDAFILDYKTGIDVDLIAGYDWGAFRTEIELAYKRASIDEVTVDIPTGFGDVDADGKVRVISGMANLLLDFEDEGWGAYVGPGVGLAAVRHRAFTDAILDGRNFSMRASDRVLAWQIIAGVHAAVTPNIDVGLKYRFFNTARLRYEEDNGGGVDSPPFDLHGTFESHSLLASLIYNFYTPPPPPPPPVVVAPPPPPPPATKTCPDGSVVLATDPCPLPPPPPPPPPPLPERG